MRLNSRMFLFVGIVIYVYLTEICLQICFDDHSGSNASVPQNVGQRKQILILPPKAIGHHIYDHLRYYIRWIKRSSNTDDVLPLCASHAPPMSPLPIKLPSSGGIQLTLSSVLSGLGVVVVPYTG